MIGERCGRFVMILDHEAAHAARLRYPYLGDAGLPGGRAGNPRVHVKMQIERALEEACAVCFPG